ASSGRDALRVAFDKGLTTSPQAYRFASIPTLDPKAELGTLCAEPFRLSTMTPVTLFRTLAVATTVWLIPATVFGQVFVQPRRAFKSEVRYFDFDWRSIDLLERPEDNGGGVRFYFYEREREVAERAASFLGDSYDYLYSRFG